MCCPCHKHLGLLGAELKAAHFRTCVDLLPVSKASYRGGQTPSLSPCQPHWAEGGAGTPCPGPSLQATSQETLWDRGAFSVAGIWGNAHISLQSRGLFSERRHPPGRQCPEPGRRRTLERLTPEGSTATGWHRPLPLPAPCPPGPRPASGSHQDDPYPRSPEQAEARGNSSSVPQVLAGQAEDVTLLLSDTVLLWPFLGRNLVLSPQVTHPEPVPKLMWLLMRPQNGGETFLFWFHRTTRRQLHLPPSQHRKGSPLRFLGCLQHNSDFRPRF